MIVQLGARGWRGRGIGRHEDLGWLVVHQAGDESLRNAAWKEYDLDRDHNTETVRSPLKEGEIRSIKEQLKKRYCPVSI